MPKVTQLVLNLQSKPGVLATVCGILSQAGINVEGMWASDTGASRGKIRLLVADTAAAEAALRAAKFRCAREEAVSLDLENRPGTLAEAARQLAQAKVNIKCAYATTEGVGRARVILTVSNIQKAMRALGG